MKRLILLLGLIFCAISIHAQNKMTYPLYMGKVGISSGKTYYYGITSGLLEVRVNAAAGTGTVFEYPATNGTNNYVLITNGSGVTSWSAVPSHTQAVSTISDATTIGQNFVKLTNPSAITFPRINADNTLSALSASDFRTAIGATSGTVTSVATGLGLSGGTITSTGTLLVDTANASILSRQRAAKTYATNQAIHDSLAAALAGATATLALADSANGGGADQTYVTGKDHKTDMASKQDIVANVSSTEISYLNNTTSEIQSQINAKLTTSTGTRFTAPIGNDFSSTATSESLTANYVLVAKFYLPYSLTVNTIGAYVSTAASASTINLGIYSSDGNTKIIDSGAITSTSTGYLTAAVSSVVLIPGFYWCAYSASDAAIRVTGFGNNGVSGFLRDAYIYGVANNATNAGVMPSTLGTISATSNNGFLIILTNY